MLPRGNDEPKKAAANGGLGASLRICGHSADTKLKAN
jgi:hypothetical protein